MNNQNIEKMYIFTSKDDSTGNLIPSELTIFYEDGSVKKEQYDVSVHDNLAQEFLQSKGFDMSNPDCLLNTVGLFEIHPVGSDKHSEIERISKYNIETPDEEELETSPVEELEKIGKDFSLSKPQKMVAATLAGTVIAGSAVALAVDTADETDKTAKSESEVSELLSQLPEDNERRIFFETVDTVLSELNALALDKEVFALEEDKEAVLEFSTDEIISALIVLNNYSSEELTEIFGDKELNSKAILSNYQRFAFKMSIYAMNGKAPSTISSLIRDEENRIWFETIENALVKFNKKQSNENADKLIRLFAYFYQHGINGTDSLENDEASLNSVKNLVLNMMRGYYDANVEEEYSQYLVVSTEPSDFDNKYRENKLSQVQKGETLKFYLDEADKGVCTISVIEQHIKDTIENLQDGTKEIDSVKLQLVEMVSDADEDALAQKILEEGLSDEVLLQFETANKKSIKALSLYRNALSPIDSSMPSFDEIRKALNEAYGPFEEIKDDILYNNRIRGLEKINEFSNGSVLTEDAWNNMTSEEQEEYIKENGEIVSTTTRTEEEQVSYEDLTPEEKEEVDKQKEEITDSVQVGEETFTGDTTVAAKAGYNDAVSFAEESGAYSHAEVYNKINPKYPTVVPTNGTLSNIAQVVYAFEGKSITINDSQIQARLASDLAAYKKTTSDSEMIAAYKKAWISAMNQKLSSAISAGAELRKQAEEEYQKAQNAQTTTKKPETTTQKQETTTTKPAETTTTKPSSTTTTKPTETTTQKQETTKDETPVVTEKPNDNVIDPNLHPTIEDSDDGFSDIYDEHYDGYISSDKIDDTFAYFADEMIEETTKVLTR